MDICDSCKDPIDILSFLSGLDGKRLNENNFINYLDFDITKQRQGMVETLAMESYALHYIGNQIARLKPDSRIILSDGKRRPLDEIIRENGRPAAVFITSMSSNFPTAVATTLALNSGRIPVVIGGIHVSTSPQDIQRFILPYTKYSGLITQVRGAGDSKVMAEVLSDIGKGRMKKEYTGHITIEDGNWGAKNIEHMDPLRMNALKRIPLIGNYMSKKLKVNVTTPYLGCQYSCNFCSISTLPQKERRFRSRSPADFIAELNSFQKDRVDFNTRGFLFLPDNLLFGGRILEEILDEIIASDLKIDYGAQISIEVAKNEKLLDKLRQSGATHFYIGLESLDLDNLKYIGKNVVRNIENSGLSVEEYYSRQIKRIQDKGISIHAAFIIGLPNDHFNSLYNHTGRNIADFCIKNKIGLQLTSFTDLPGSKKFNESQANGNYIYGRQGTIGYLLSLCISDLSESNRMPPESLCSSPLVVSYMLVDGIKRACSARMAIRNGLYIAGKSFACPTKNGLRSLKERFIDSACSFASQLIASQYYDHVESIIYSSKKIKGLFERLFDNENDPKVRKIFADYIKSYKCKDDSY